MLTLNRISLLLAVTFVAPLLAVIATTLSRGQTTVSANQNIRVLRRKDQRNLPLTAAEIAAFRGQMPKEERELEDKIPAHVPIRVKIRAEKEQAFKDLNNEHWARDLEIEIKNTGTKPIYRLVLLLLLPETQIGGGRILFSLHYGRVELSAFKETLEFAKPEDVPIKPGETYIFKIPDGQIRGWERFQLSEKWPQPKKILIKFEQLNFGDGTGYRWGEGVPWPQPKAGLGACLQGPDPYTSVAKANHARLRKRNDEGGAWKFSLGGEPASFLPAKFLYASSLLFLGSIEWNLEPDDPCCPSGCQYVREYDCYNIYGRCGDPTPTPGGGGDPGSGTDPNSNPVMYKTDCVDYYWVHFVSYDGGQTWSYNDNETYAGCFYEY